MDLYLSSLVLGAVGLGAMALSGVGNRGHGAPTSGHGHAAGGHAAGGHAAGGHAGGGRAAAGQGNAVAHTGHAAQGTHATHAAPNAASRAIWAVMSPRVLFSFFLGFGAAGLLGHPFLGGPILLAAAAAGGVVFERALVAPLWNLLMRFASTPSSNLESAVTDEATAVTSFDENGQGIVSIEMDGQITQILATLRPNDRLLGGARIRAGQRVRVEEVDSEQNRCTVSLI
jgi:hypothetical protein